MVCVCCVAKTQTHRHRHTHARTHANLLVRSSSDCWRALACVCTWSSSNTREQSAEEGGEGGGERGAQRPSTGLPTLWHTPCRLSGASREGG